MATDTGRQHGPPTAETRLARARSRLELRGRVEDADLAAPLLDSWQRCLGARLDPLDRPEHLVAAPKAFGELLSRHDILRRLARPELELLFGQVRGSNYMLALGAPEGVVTDVLADTSFLDTEAGRTVIEGSIWREDVRGTNAMGLTLHDLAPRSVWRGEHFFRCHEAVSCLSVPIFDSAGGLAGVLDASTGSAEWHPHTMTLLGMSAANIEAGLFHFEQGDHTILRVHPRAEYLFTMSAGLLAIDRDGAIAAISRRAREVLQLGPGAAPAGIDDLMVDGVAEIRTQLAAGVAVRGRPVGGGTVFLASNHWRMTRAVPAGAATAPAGGPAGTPARPVSRDRSRPASRAVPFVAEDVALRRQLAALHRVLPSRTPILIAGETGTGKRRLARHVHGLVAAGAPFVAIHCAGISEASALDELRRLGCMPEAPPGAAPDGAADGTTPAGGVLFIDRIDELPPRAQAVLARFLDDGASVGEGNGGGAPWIVSSIDDGSGGAAARLRPDLYYHVAAFSLTLPPLRRRSDLVRLAEAQLSAIAPGMTLDRAARDPLRAHDWPGNLRELEARLKVAAALAEGRAIGMHDLLRALAAAQAGSPEANRATDAARVSPCRSCRDSPLRRTRCISMRETYLAQGRNATRTARALGIARSTLYEHLRGLPAG